MRDKQRRFRALMGRFVTGVTVIGVGGTPEIRAMTANAVTAVSLDPLLLLVCIRNESNLLPALMQRQRFSVNVLAACQDMISRHYGGSPQVSCPAEWTWSEEDIPVLTGANVSFACRIHAAHVAGDHTVIYGEVTNMTARDPAAPALVYAAGRYHDVPLAA